MSDPTCRCAEHAVIVEMVSIVRAEADRISLEADDA